MRSRCRFSVSSPIRERKKAIEFREREGATDRYRHTRLERKRGRRDTEMSTVASREREVVSRERDTSTERERRDSIREILIVSREREREKRQYKRSNKGEALLTHWSTASLRTACAGNIPSSYCPSARTTRPFHHSDESPNSGDSTFVSSTSKIWKYDYWQVVVSCLHRQSLSLWCLIIWHLFVLLKKCAVRRPPINSTQTSSLANDSSSRVRPGININAIALNKHATKQTPSTMLGSRGGEQAHARNTVMEVSSWGPLWPLGLSGWVALLIVFHIAIKNVHACS